MVQARIFAEEIAMAIEAFRMKSNAEIYQFGQIESGSYIVIVDTNRKGWIVDLLRYKGWIVDILRYNVTELAQDSPYMNISRTTTLNNLF